MFYYRAFYLPAKGSYVELVEDNEKLEELPSDPLLVIKIDTLTGAREIISEKTNLTKKEQYFFDYAYRQTAYRHDGGPSAEHIALLKENPKMRGNPRG